MKLNELSTWTDVVRKRKAVNKEKGNEIEIVFVIDRSGSMGGLEDDTIGGFNSMLDEQKKETGNAYVTTVLFNDNVNVLHNHEDIDNVHSLTSEDYKVGGCTALLDAVGGTIKTINKKQKAAGVKRKTLFIIITDGMENSSKKYNADEVKAMIEKKQSKKGWQFIFLGANIDAVAEAQKIGISANRAAKYEYSSAGTKRNFHKVSGLAKLARKCKDIEEMEEYFDCDDLLDDIRVD